VGTQPSAKPSAGQGSFAAFLAANNSPASATGPNLAAEPEPEPEPVAEEEEEDDVLEISMDDGSVSMGSQFSISGGGTPTAAGGNLNDDDEEEDVLEIDGSMELGSDISFAGDTPTSENPPAAAAAADADDDEVDAISFEDGDDLGIEDDVEIELELSASDGDAASAAISAAPQIPRAFSQGTDDPPRSFAPAPAPAPAPTPAPVSKNGDLDSGDLARIGRWLAAEPGSLSRAEEDSGMTYKREFIMYLQKRASELPDGRGLEFLRSHGINGKVDSIRKARNRGDLHKAYMSWQSLSELYERGPGGQIQLKRPRDEVLREKWGRKKGEDSELDEIDDLLGPDTPPPASKTKPKSSFSSTTGGGGGSSGVGGRTSYSSAGSDSDFGASRSGGLSSASSYGGYSTGRGNREPEPGPAASAYSRSSSSSGSSTAPYSAAGRGPSTGTSSASSLSGVPSLAPAPRPVPADVSGGSGDFMDDIDAILNS
jgi:hypothetical protein